MATSEQHPGGDTYRRRRRLPALALLLVLALVVAFVWSKALGSTTEQSGAAACPTPPAASTAPSGVKQPAIGTSVTASSLDGTAPAAPGSFAVRVLNANGQRGQAALTLAELVNNYGFKGASTPFANDTVYFNQDMQCLGQIRFGTKGLAQARTLHLAVPCAQLVRDKRTDTGVDLALGTTFSEVNPSTDATSVLATLKASAAGAAEVDPTLLSSADTTRC